MDDGQFLDMQPFLEVADEDVCRFVREFLSPLERAGDLSMCHLYQQS